MEICAGICPAMDLDIYMHTCSGCTQISQVSKGLSIYAAPKALVMHLKRIDMFYGKLKKHIAFQVTLALHSATHWLVAVLIHSDASLDCGHYYAYVKSPADQWYKMDDERMQLV